MRDAFVVFLCSEEDHLRNKCGVVGWCPLCYSGHRGRAAYRGHARYSDKKSSKGWAKAMGLKKPMSKVADLPEGVTCADPAWSSRWPLLSSHLFDLKYEDGTPRSTSTLMILGEHSVVKACLNDREEARSAWVSGRTVDEALGALEVGLMQDSLDWRARPAGRWEKKRGK